MFEIFGGRDASKLGFISLPNLSIKSEVVYAKVDDFISYMLGTSDRTADPRVRRVTASAGESVTGEGGRQQRDETATLPSGVSSKCPPSREAMVRPTG